ncbi:hypothetical protein BGW42_005419 [Actinomortierella wolfii]|nr:hypothetical protein BGW42_005419 [Actinomortierella wolfii]
MSSEPELLPLHGAGSDGRRSMYNAASLEQTIKSYIRQLARRLNSYRIALIALVILTLYIMFYTLGSSQYLHKQQHPTLADDTEALFGSNMSSYSFKKDKTARDRILLEWETRANYRTDLANVGSSRQSAYSARLFEDVSTTTGSTVQGSNSNSQYIPITAVVLSWKRKEGTQAVVSFLQKYPYIKEILVWNNNKEDPLHASDFQSQLDALPEHKPSITVFNAEANLHDYSKYTTCVLAKYDHCYFQDDDWINLSMDSMYTLFIENPNILVTNTMPAMSAQQRSWMFQNSQFHMHTGFSWIGSGTFVSKKDVFRFIMQLGGSNLWKERIQHADMYFTLWRNQYPYVLTHALAPMDQSSAWSQRIDPWSEIHSTLSDAVQRLGTVLSGEGVIQGSPHRIGAKSDFLVSEETPLFKDRHSRSVCTNDRCLFQTNIDMFPAPESVKWSPEGKRDIQVHEAKYRALDYPSAEFVAMHAYHYAVDQDPKTCWRSFRSPQTNDYFGLQLVVPINPWTGTPSRSNEVELRTTLKASVEAFKHNIRIKASQNGRDWYGCEASNLKENDETSTLPGLKSLVFSELKCNGLAGGNIRFIRFEFDDSVEDAIEVCSIRIGDMTL